MEKVIQPILAKSRRHALSPIAKGYLFMAVVLLIWSGFALSVRAVGSSALTMADMALIRFIVPMVLLTPMLPACLKELKNVRLGDACLILLGGVPFLFLASIGAETAPTAYVGTILAGTPPFFVALLAFVFCRQLFSRKQIGALALLLSGIATMVLGRSMFTGLEVPVGVFYLLGAAMLWGGYTMGIKRSGLSPISVAVLLSYISFFITLGLVVSGAVPSNVGDFSWQEAMPYVVVQGLGVGVLSTIGFSYAVSQLGSAKASTIGSISPCLTALLAVVIFNEPLTLAIVCGVALTVIGVVLFNRR